MKLSTAIIIFVLSLFALGFIGMLSQGDHR
jgi:hypothetical protein